ncbi:kinase-like protein [Leucogyrophana mollusca]|uniref:Kinase-like protein n=1 Tax=Leucogyrophana mollusca TaxID=85980 RepID=A0ACB8BDJ8_9AGAM|nr:kinase-like protein [Leucogyrophana mollusca]
MICPPLYMYTLMLLQSYVPSQVDSLRAKYSQWKGDEIAQIIYCDSIITTLRRYLDQCEVEYHRSSDPALVNRILKLDALCLATRIRVVTKDRRHRKLLVNLKESQAQSLLDLLQELLDSFELEDIRSSLVRTIVELSKRSGLYPTRLILRNLTIPSGLPSAGGSFGDVFKGDLGGQAVAVKIMRVFGAPAVESLTKVSVLWAQLSSPYVLPFCGVYNMTEPSPRMCLVSPWMDHGTLTQYLENSSQANRLSLMLDVALGLEYLHSFDPPVIHGDLKGANILITADLRACVADFGLCTLAQDSNLQFTNSSSNGKGSAPWMAPELFSEDDAEQKRKTCASDIYAFGCVGYEIFSGNPPFARLSSYKIIPAIMENRPLPQPASAELDDVIWGLIGACRGVDPGSRPKASEVVQQLRSHPTVCDRKEPVWDQNKSIVWRLLATLTSASLAAPVSEGGPKELRGPHFVYHRRDTSGPSLAEKRH